jgi:hypothetical protein
MITEELISHADEKIRSLYSENERLRFWIYVLFISPITEHFDRELRFTWLLDMKQSIGKLFSCHYLV